LTRKLSPYGDSAEIGEVLDALAGERLQSDARYVEAYIRSRAARGYGPKRIEIELKQRGVAREEISTGLADIDEDWDGHARRADRKKFGNAAPDVALYAKRRHHLEYRGFRPEQIKNVLAESVD
jgi:regulatory protein